MSRLVRLYPAAWRARYEAELQGILAEHPLTPRQRLDLVWGAIDAHLHPGLAGPPSAVLAGAGPGMVVARHESPTTTAFATAVAVTALVVGALLVLQAGVALWGGRSLQQALLAIGGVALGLVLRRSGGTDPLTRVGTTILLLSVVALVMPLLWDLQLAWPTTERRRTVATLMAAATVAIGALAAIRGRAWLVRTVRAEPRRVVTAVWFLLMGAAVAWLLGRADPPGGIGTMRLADSLPAVTTVSLGSAVAGLGALLVGRPDRLTGLALVGLAVVLAAGYQAGSIRAVGTAMLGLALVSAWVGWRPNRRTGRASSVDRRGVAVGLVAGAVVISAGAGVAISTSGWAPHDGYALACETEQEACVAAAARVAGAVRAGAVEAMVETVRVQRDGAVDICWTDAIVGRQCWFLPAAGAAQPRWP